MTNALIGLTLCIGAFPVAFIITILLIPIWRWLESTFQMEAVGHSGPAEWCYLSTYILTITLAGITWSRVRKHRLENRR